MKKENSSNFMNSSVRMTNIYKKRIGEIANFLHLTRYRTLIQKAIFQLQEEEQTMDSGKSKKCLSFTNFYYNSQLYHTCHLHKHVL